MTHADDSLAVERLSAEDVRILGLETPRVAGHVMKVTVLAADAQPLGLDALRTHVAGRLDRIPRLVERLAPTPGGSGLAWAPDPDFDVARHVRRPSHRGALRAAVARSMEERLDRDRPLWAIDLVDDRAIVLKVHHAMADGMAVRRIATALLWDVDAVPAPGLHAAAPEPLVRHRLVHVPHLAAAIERELMPSVPVSELAARVGPDRDVAFASVSLTQLASLRDAFGAHVTVNDLVLAATAGGLRRWLGSQGVPARPMRVKVPVSLHRPDESPDALGNADSFFFVDLPVQEADPIARLRAISDECSARKRAQDALELGTLLHVAGSLSPAAGRALVHWSMSPHVFTLNVSNVPGPPGTVRVCGRPVKAVYALAEVADWHALRIAVFSAGGVLTFGLCADSRHVSGLELLAKEIEDEVRLLGEAA